MYLFRTVTEQGQKVMAVLKLVRPVKAAVR